MRKDFPANDPGTIINAALYLFPWRLTTLLQVKAVKPTAEKMLKEKVRGPAHYFSADARKAMARPLYLHSKTSHMDNRQKLELMNKLLREIDDLKNSQTSVLKKVAQIEAENINLGDQSLDKFLPEIHSEADASLEQISGLYDAFASACDAFEKKHPLPEVV